MQKKEEFKINFIQTLSVEAKKDRKRERERERRRGEGVRKRKRRRMMKLMRTKTRWLNEKQGNYNKMKEREDLFVEKKKDVYLRWIAEN